MEPDNAFTYCDRAAQYAKQYELDKAIADYGRAIELNPCLASAYLGRGEVYGKQKRWNAAIADLNRAVDLDPGQAAAYDNRGRTYGERRDWQRALADFQQVVSWAPLDSGGYYLIACTLAATEDLQATYHLQPEFPEGVSLAIGQLAWVLATHPDAKWRNGDQALRYAEEMVAMQSPKTPWSLERPCCVVCRSRPFSAGHCRRTAGHRNGDGGTEPIGGGEHPQPAATVPSQPTVSRVAAALVSLTTKTILGEWPSCPFFRPQRNATNQCPFPLPERFDRPQTAIANRATVNAESGAASFRGRCTAQRFCGSRSRRARTAGPCTTFLPTVRLSAFAWH